MTSSASNPRAATDDRSHFRRATRLIQLHRSIRPVAALLITALFTVTCEASTPAPTSDQSDSLSVGQVVNSIYLIGDAGEFPVPTDILPYTVEPRGEVLQSLHRDVMDRCTAIGADATAVIFLGDNLYPEGLVPAGDPDRMRGERILDSSVAAAGPAPVYFTMGNHDWQHGGDEAWDYVVREGDYLQSLRDGVSVQPPAGCPGPTHVDIGRHIRVIFLDPAAANYWFEHPDLSAPCAVAPGDNAVAMALHEEFANPDGRFVVFATHYPFISCGPHSGTFTWKEHIFPLRDKNPNLWLPLPIIGSFYVWYRSAKPSPGDMESTSYREYLTELQAQFAGKVPQLLAAGHEHSLQLHRDESRRFQAVSGGGSEYKITPVRPSDTALIAVSKPGFMRLDIYESGWVKIVVIEVDDGERKEIYSMWLGKADS